MKTYKADDYNWIQFENNKVIDLAVGNHYAGCRCSLHSKYKNVGDCPEFEDCLDTVIRFIKIAGI